MPHTRCNPGGVDFNLQVKVESEAFSVLLDQQRATSLSGDHRTSRRNPVSLLPKNNTSKSFRNSKTRGYSKNVLMFKDTFFLLIEIIER